MVTYRFQFNWKMIKKQKSFWKCKLYSNSRTTYKSEKINSNLRSVDIYLITILFIFFFSFKTGQSLRGGYTTVNITGVENSVALAGPPQSTRSKCDGRTYHRARCSFSSRRIFDVKQDDGERGEDYKGKRRHESFSFLRCTTSEMFNHIIRVLLLLQKKKKPGKKK